MIARTREVDASAIRLSRRLRTLYRCNREFFQAQNEQELLQSVCQILVAGGDLWLGWFGSFWEDARKTLTTGAEGAQNVDNLGHRTIVCGGGRRGGRHAASSRRTG